MRTFFISFKIYRKQVRVNRGKGSGVVREISENLNLSDGK